MSAGLTLNRGLSRTTERALSIDRSRGVLVLNRLSVITAAADFSMRASNHLAGLEAAARSPQAQARMRYLADTATTAMGYEIMKLGVDL